MVPILFIGIVVVGLGILGLAVFRIQKSRKGDVPVGTGLHFYTRGKEAGFSFREAETLRKLALQAGLEDPTLLFSSRDKLETCIRSLAKTMNAAGETEKSFNWQLLSHLYDFRQGLEPEGAGCRVRIHWAAFLYPLEEGAESRIEVEPGLKCYVEELSDSGFNISLEGRIQEIPRLKVQFALHNAPVVLPGILKEALFEEEANRSLFQVEPLLLPEELKIYLLLEVFGSDPSEAPGPPRLLTEKAGLSPSEGRSAQGTFVRI